MTHASLQMCLQLKMIVACCLIRGKCIVMINHSCGVISQVALPAGDPRLPPRMLLHLSNASGSSNQEPKGFLLSSPRRGMFHLQLCNLIFQPTTNTK